MGLSIGPTVMFGGMFAMIMVSGEQRLMSRLNGCRSRRLEKDGGGGECEVRSFFLFGS